MDNASFLRGFMFAMHLHYSLECNVPVEEVVEQLRQILSGDVTLVPSEADAIAGIEHEVGKPMPETLRRSIRETLKNRAERDAEFREAAKIILEMLGVDKDKASG